MGFISDGISVLIIRDTRELTSLSVHRRKAMWGQSEKSDICKPGRELWPETESTRALILYSQVHCSVVHSGQDMKQSKDFHVLEISHAPMVECYSAEVMPFVTPWMNLEGTMLNEISQREISCIIYVHF